MKLFSSVVFLLLMVASGFSQTTPIPQISIVTSAASPVARVVPAGSNGVTFMVASVSAIGGDVPLTSLTVFSNNDQANYNLHNITLLKDGSVVGTLYNMLPKQTGDVGPKGKVLFSIPLVIAKNTVVNVTIRADIDFDAGDTDKINLGVFGYESSVATTSKVDAPSGNYMTISSNHPFLKVLSPNGGESFVSGTEMKICWYQSRVDTVSIDLRYGSTAKTIVSGYKVPFNSKNECYTWVIDSKETPRTNYQIYIIGYYTGIGSHWDLSDGVFAITAALPAVKLTVTRSAATPPSQSIEAGTNNFKFTAIDMAVDKTMSLTGLGIYATNAEVLGDARIYNGSTLLGSVTLQSFEKGGAGFISFGQNVVLPANSTTTFWLAADVKLNLAETATTALDINSISWVPNVTVGIIGWVNTIGNSMTIVSQPTQPTEPPTTPTKPNIPTTPTVPTKPVIKPFCQKQEIDFYFNNGWDGSVNELCFDRLTGSVRKSLLFNGVWGTRQIIPLQVGSLFAFGQPEIYKYQAHEDGGFDLQSWRLEANGGVAFDASESEVSFRFGWENRAGKVTLEKDGGYSYKRLPPSVDQVCTKTLLANGYMLCINPNGPKGSAIYGAVYTPFGINYSNNKTFFEGRFPVNMAADSERVFVSLSTQWPPLQSSLPQIPTYGKIVAFDPLTGAEEVLVPEVDVQGDFTNDKLVVSNQPGGKHGFFFTTTKVTGEVYSQNIMFYDLETNKVKLVVEGKANDFFGALAVLPNN